jgi:hypothetical protein
MAEEGDLASMRELADRLDGRPAQIIDGYDNVPPKRLTDAQLNAIAACRLTESDCEPKALPAPGKSAAQTNQAA